MRNTCGQRCRVPHRRNHSCSHDHFAELDAHHLPGLSAGVRLINHWLIDRGKRAYLERTRDHLKELYRDGQAKEP